MDHEKDCSCALCTANRRIEEKRKKGGHTCCGGNRDWCCCRRGRCRCREFQQKTTD